MLKLNKVAITGGLACGKSTFCRFLKELGACLVSADEIVHQQISPETKFGKQLIGLLGQEILKKGQIDRGEIAYRVFREPRLLETIEKWIHPLVYETINKNYDQVCKTESHRLFIAEVPLLFESKGEVHFDTTIAVVAPDELCRLRYGEHSGQNVEDFWLRSRRHLSNEEKAKKADIVIRNEATIEQLKEEAQKVYNQLAV